MPQLDRLSVVLPVLNERDNLAEIVPELCDVLSREVAEFEILVVDDSSTDGTDALLAQLSRSDTRVRYIRRDGKEPSLPMSINDGVEAAQYNHVAWMDADGSMPPAMFRDLISSYRSDTATNVIVVGSRFVNGGGFKGIETVGETRLWQVVRNLRDSNDSLSAVFLSRMLNRYLWLTLDRFCRDLASGFIIARRDDVRSIGLIGSYGDYCVRFLYLAHKLGLTVREVPYVCLVRRHGYSKTGTTLWGLIKRGVPYVMLPIRIRRIALLGR
jgi:dolichol-phosphate mannosyltransferase